MQLTYLTILCLAITPFVTVAQYDPQALEKAVETIDTYKAKDKKFELYFEDAYGYVVFPKIGKGAYGIGGAFGSGIVYEQGSDIGKAKFIQVSIGFQLGGQAYSMVVFFETKEAFEQFKEGQFEFAAQASAVAIEEGASAHLSYKDGVAIFSMTKGGLMYEAALGGQKMTFKPYKNK